MTNPDQQTKDSDCSIEMAKINAKKDIIKHGTNWIGWLIIVRLFKEPISNFFKKTFSFSHKDKEGKSVAVSITDSDKTNDVGK